MSTDVSGPKNPVFEKYKPRIRDVMLENLRSSAALAHVCAKAIDSIDSSHPQYQSREFTEKLPGWFYTLGGDSDGLQTSQNILGRDLRFLIIDPRSLEVLDSIKAAPADFDLTKPQTIREPIERHTTITHRAASDHLKHSPYPDSAGYHQKQEAIRDAVVKLPPNSNKSNEQQISEVIQNGYIQNSSIIEPKEIKPENKTQPGLAQSTHPFLRSPYYQDYIKRDSIKNVPNDSESNGQIVRTKRSVSPFRIEPTRVDNSSLSIQSNYPLSSSVYGIADTPRYERQPRESSSTIKRSSDVIVNGGNYSNRREGSSVRKLEVPVEGRIERLDEKVAVPYKMVGKKPSTYVRVTKEYKGESYILTGRAIGQDGKEIPPVRETISYSNYNKNSFSNSSAIQREAKMTETVYIPHLSQASSQQNSKSQDKAAIYRLRESEYRQTAGQSTVTKQLFQDSGRQLSEGYRIMSESAERDRQASELQAKEARDEVDRRRSMEDAERLRRREEDDRRRRIEDELRQEEKRRLAEDIRKAEDRKNQEDQEKLRRQRELLEQENRKNEQLRLAREKARAEEGKRIEESNRLAREAARAEEGKRIEESNRLAREKARAEEGKRIEESNRLAREKARAEEERLREQNAKLAHDRDQGELSRRSKEDNLRLAKEMERALDDKRSEELARLVKEKEIREAERKEEENARLSREIEGRRRAKDQQEIERLRMQQNAKELQDAEDRRKEEERKLEREKTEREASRARELQRLEEEEIQRKLKIQKDEELRQAQLLKKAEEERKKEQEHQDFLVGIKEVQRNKVQSENIENSKVVKSYYTPQTAEFKNLSINDDDDYLDDIDKDKGNKNSEVDYFTMDVKDNDKNKIDSYDNLSFNDGEKVGDDSWMENIDKEYLSSERKLKMRLDAQEEERMKKIDILAQEAKQSEIKKKQDDGDKKRMDLIEAEKRKAELDKQEEDIRNMELERKRQIEASRLAQRPSIINIQPVPVQHQRPFYQPVAKASKFSEPRTIRNINKPLRKYKPEIKPITTKTEISAIMSKLQEVKISIENLEDDSNLNIIRH